MIIQIEAGGADELRQARRDLQDLAGGWGHQLSGATAALGAEGGGKSVDPVAVASLVVSLPSAVLAVADLADRMRKRRRAAELIEHARRQAARQVTMTVITPGRIIQLTALTPDQLLDLQDDPGPAD